MNETQAGSNAHNERGEVNPRERVDMDRRLVGTLLDAGAALGAKLVIANSSGEVAAVRGLSPGVVHEINSESLPSDPLAGVIKRVLERALKGLRADQTFVLQGPPKRSLVLFGMPYTDAKGIIAGAVILIWDTTEQRYVDSLTVDFIASLAHELKSPLGAISILADSIEIEPDLQAKSALLAKLQREVARAADLVDSLQAMSRAEAENAISFETLPASQLVEACVERVRTLAESRRITIDVDCEDSATVYGNARELTSAICHLAENAIQLTEPGGKIEISAQADDWLTRISVRDYSFGIEADDQVKIFERFVRLDNARERRAAGSGLGLSIVKRVAFANGGEVKVLSEPGKGSTFTLQLAGYEPLQGG